MRPIAFGGLVPLAAAVAIAGAVPPAAAQQPTPTMRSAAPAPGHAGAPAGTTGRAQGQSAGYTAADVEFMQHMIGHHAQALAMTALIGDRTSTEAIRLLGQRISISQRDEIALMRHWLQARGEAVPDSGAAHGHHGDGHETLMPGMLTPEELARLAAAHGADFDRLFLESMIRHHEGALVMVKALFGVPGAAQEPTAFRFASDVDTDQRAEIARMRGMLASMPPGTPHP
jgi:uncharacterized protein (DUF305 family)